MPILSSCELPTVVKELPLLSDDFDSNTKSIYDLISANGAFKNPLNSVLTNAHEQVNTTMDDLLGLQASPPSGHTYTDLQDYIDKSNTLLTSKDSFLSHSDRLSGVDLTSNHDTHDLGVLLSLGTGSVSLDHTLNSVVGNPCGKMLGLFGSLICGEQQFADIISYYEKLVDVINEGVVTATQIKGQLDAFKNSVDTLVSNDRLNAQNYINELKQAALSKMLGSSNNDPCFQYIVKNKIGSSALLEKL